MKRKNQLMQINSLIENFRWVMLSCIFLTCSCRKSSEGNVRVGEGIVKVIAAEATYDYQHNPDTSTGLRATSQIRQSNWGNEVSVLAELIAEEGSRTRINRAGIKRGATGQTESIPLDAHVKYKLLVYDDKGSYVTERDYSYTQEHLAEELSLQGGRAYTFVAYSFNSKSSDLPNIVFADKSARTIANSSLVNVAGDVDFIYFRKEMFLISGESNDLKIVFKHMSSEVSMILDASAVGLPITRVQNVVLGSHRAHSNISLSDGRVLSSTEKRTVTVNFPILGKQEAAAQRIIMNPHSNVEGKFVGDLYIESITIGTVTRGPITLSGFDIKPGVKYTLRIRFNPNDEYMDYHGWPVARIGGTIWMRHNLDQFQPMTVDPDVMNVVVMGNYYKWGERTARALADHGFTPILNWLDNYYPTSESWNTGTELDPDKNLDYDPCPFWFRVPTAAEFESLLAVTDQHNIGSWASDQNDHFNYGAGKVLTSKANTQVKLTFSTNGFRRSEHGALNSRAQIGNYWTSHYDTNQQAVAMVFEQMLPAQVKSNSVSGHTGMGVRCVAR